MPGIRRDGTDYSGNYYIDGQHCRFQRGLPQKMGGHRETIGNLDYPSRGIYVNPSVSQADLAIFSGDQNTLQEFFINQDGTLISSANRTPIGFRQDPNNMWNFDVIYSATSGNNYIFAHAAPNLSDINSQIETPIYYGLLSSGGIDDTSVLSPMGHSVSGGMIALHPFLMTYSNDGLVSWTDERNPLDVVNTESICSQKIVTALQTRAGNAAPGALFWSLDTLIRAYFSPLPGNIPNFRFDTISDQTSIMSQNSVIEYDGLYFWVAQDRFCLYNGTTKEVPNDMNLNYFFDNLNYSQRQKVWVTKYPRKGEIWVFFPSGNSTEANAAVVYNIRENKWYDTLQSRGAGYFEQIYPYPIWASNSPRNGKYSIYTQEVGTDAVYLDGTVDAIPSFFETGDIAFCALGPTGQWTGVNRWVAIDQIEPDFIQTGDMTVAIKGREYSRSELQASEPLTFTPTTARLNPRAQYRHMTLRFDSNVVGGYYEMGQPLLSLSIGDARS
jgi:hypothetical protein